MHQDDLERNIEQLRRQPLPSAPSNLEDRVWRNIRQAEAGNPATAWWEALLPRPALAFSALAAAMALSAALTAATVVTQTPDRRAELSQALGFEALTSTQYVHLDSPQP